jgi:hypothetical protein
MRASKVVGVLVAAGWVGCAPSGDLDGSKGVATDETAAAQLLPEQAVAAPLDLTLTVDQTLIQGVPVTFRVAGVPPGREVRFAYSLVGAAGGSCPPAWGGVCLEIQDPVRFIGRATADASGRATLTGVPPASTIGQTIYLQAVSPEGANTHTSNVVVRTVLAYVDNDNDGYSVQQGDCNDNIAAVNPGAPELCDTFDNNCDGQIDGSDAWWDADWPYRIPVTVTNSPDWETFSAAAAVDVDFGAALAALGDTSAFDPDSVRVVYQNCGAGMPELPTEFMDDVAGVFSRSSLDDPPNNDEGAVAFLVDTDGNYATRDRLLAGASRSFSIYFGSTGTMPGVSPQTYNSSLVASSDGTTSELSNSLTEALFEASSGGLATHLATVGYNSVGAQDVTGFGNGIYLGAWTSARDGVGVAMELVHDGPIFGAVRTSGSVSNANGGYDYTYTYFQFEGRPEIYAQVEFVLNQTSTIGPQNPFFGAGVRPYMTDNNALALSATSEGAAGIPDFEWVRGAYATGGSSSYGIAAGYRLSVALRSRPIYSPTGNDAGRYVGLSGQDAVSIFGTQPSYTGSSGEVIVDNAIVAIYPHAGPFGGVSLDFYGTLDGVTTVTGAPQAW